MLTEGPLHHYEHRWSIRIWAAAVLLFLAAASGYYLALDGAGVAAPNVAPIKEAKTSSAYRMVWFGNFTAAKVVFLTCAPLGVVAALMGALVRIAENRNIKKLYEELQGEGLQR